MVNNAVLKTKLLKGKALRINSLTLMIDNDDDANNSLQKYLNSHAIRNLKFVIVIAFLYAIVTVYAYLISKRPVLYSLVLNTTMSCFWTLSYILTRRFPNLVQFFVFTGFVT